MDGYLGIFHRIWPESPTPSVTLALGLAGALLLIALVARLVFFRPFDPTAIVKSLLKVAAATLQQGPLEGGRAFGKEVGDLIGDAVGPGEGPVTDALKSEAADILWRQWRDRRRDRRRWPKSVWRAADRLWREHADEVLLTVHELKAAGFDGALLAKRFREKLRAAGAKTGAEERSLAALWSVLEGLYPALVERPKAQQAVQLLMGQRMLELQAQTAAASKRIEEHAVDTQSRVSDAHVAIVGVAGDIAELKGEIIKPLDVVDSFHQLSDDQVRRLPTVLVVADYGLTPYDDSRGLKADCLRWALDPVAAGPSGRLYAAEGGFGKTRLALEVIAALRDQHGWRTGLLPRAALEKTDLRGEQDADARLKRFFDGRGSSGALLAIDYAEGRTAQIERVTKAALASKGGPIRIVLLARGAGEWWQELHREGRDIQLVYERTPIAAMGSVIEVSQREGFFWAAAEQFADRLVGAQNGDEPLLLSDWRARPTPTSRLSAPEIGSPLSLAFEAFLHVRGVNPQNAPLAEMAREERRHWARALRIRDVAAARATDPRVDFVHRTSAVITLTQGAGPSAAADIDAHLEAVLETALTGAPKLPSRDVERARAYADTKRAIEYLYRAPQGSHDSLRPILPDIVGEHIVGELYGALPALSKATIGRFGSAAAPVLTVLDRTTRPIHGADVSEVAYQALQLSMGFDTEAQAKAIVTASFQAEGRIIDALSATVPLLPEREVEVLQRALPSRAGQLSDVAGAVAARIATKPVGKIVSDTPDGTLVEFSSANELAEAYRSKTQSSFVLVESGRYQEAVDAGSSAVGYARILADTEPLPGTRDLAYALSALGTAQCANDQLEEGRNTLLEGMDIATKVAQRDGDPASQSLLSQFYHNLARCKSLLGDNSAAVYFGKKAVWARKALLAIDPDVQHDFSNSVINLSQYLAAKGNKELALKEAHDGVSALAQLREQDPKRYSESYALGVLRLGERISDAGRSADATAQFGDAYEILSRLFELAPRRYFGELLQSGLCLASAQLDTGEPAIAVQTCRDALNRAFAKTPEGEVRAQQRDRVSAILGVAIAALGKSPNGETIDGFLRSVSIDPTSVQLPTR